MESRDGEEETAGAGWIDVEGLKKGEAVGKTSREEEVTLSMISFAVLTSTEQAAGQDYVAAAGAVSLPAGAASRTFTVAVAGDLADELDETFLVALSNPVGAGIADGQAVGRIVDNDNARVSIANTSVTEGDAGNGAAQFVVSLSVPSVFPVTVKYATLTTGSAEPSADYVETAGEVQIAPGDTSVVVSVPVVGDLVDEIDETFTVGLTAPVNATLGDATGVATIVDNDDPPTISITDASIDEGDSGSKVVTFDNDTISAEPADRAGGVRHGGRHGHRRHRLQWQGSAIPAGQCTRVKGLPATCGTIQSATRS